MQSSGTKAGPVALAALIALGGCGVGAGLTGASGGAEGLAGAAAPAAAQAPGDDVLAPEVFQVREDGLWDGRPSLGGAWVAHPDVDQPDRVRIRNAESGEEIAAALFRRERDLPGPALQVSSDAAQALGMLAGDPTPLEVTALRRQDAPAADPAPQGAEPAADPDAEPESPEAIAGATAAALAGEPAPEAPPVADEPAPVPDEPAPVDPAAIEAVAQATAALLAEAALPEEPAPPPAPEATEAPLADPSVAAAAAAIVAGAASPPPTPGAIATTTLAAPDAGAPAAPAIATYVQVGRFDVQANADAAAQGLAAQGLPAGVVEVDGEGAWLVWLGPVADEAQGDTLLEAAVAAGFPDATLVQG